VANRAPRWCEQLTRLQRRTCAASSTSLPTGPRDAGAAFFGKISVDLGAVSPSHAGRFYQRILPAEQVPFSSEEGRRLFTEALLAGSMENYFYLAEQFRTQDEPTFCGLSTLAMVLNSLRIDPMRTWKGAWRWFNEQNLGCCATPEDVRESGLSFDMFRCLAGCNGADVVARRAPEATQALQVQETFVEDFRRAVRAISRSQDRECLVVCYSRESLGQTGAGHFSPIGGYHEASDSVLIMDVARFKYPPHWAPLRDVAQGMLKVDPDTGKPRGFLQLRLQQRALADSHGSAMAPPIRVPFVPAAAGRRLSEALSAALQDSAGQPWDGPLQPPAVAPASLVAMRRWLSAASTAEPQVLMQLLQVGDVQAVQEVFARLAAYAPFAELCQAYDAVASSCCLGLSDDFPALRFEAAGTSSKSAVPPVDLSLHTCGELWVLLLLLLPEHLLVAVSPELARSGVAQGATRAVRGPWALPLEALRETLGHILPLPKELRCAGRKG